MAIRIVTADGRVSKDKYEIEEGSHDHKGNCVVVSRAGRRVRINPSRMLPVNPGSPQVYYDAGDLQVKCDRCGVPVPVGAGDKTAVCKKHGHFDIDWGGLKPIAIPSTLTVLKVKKPKAVARPRSGRPIAKIKQPVTVDFDELLRTGEVWSMTELPFDYDQYSLAAHVFIITTGKPRKFSFNTYNGTWGKKSRDDVLRSFIEGRTDEHSKSWHFVSGPVEKVRKKLESAGYIKRERTK